MNQKKELPPVAYFTVMTYGGGDFAVIDIDGKQPLRVKNTAWYKFPLGKHKVYVYVAYDEDPWEMEIEAEDMSVIHLYFRTIVQRTKALCPISAPQFYGGVGYFYLHAGVFRRAS